MGEMNPKLLQSVVICLKTSYLLRFSMTTASIRPLLPCGRRKQLLLDGASPAGIIWQIGSITVSRFVETFVAWRFPLAFQFVSILLFLFVLSPRCLASSLILFIFTDTYLTCRWLLSHGHGVKVIEVLAYLGEKSDNDPFIPTLRSALVCLVYRGCVQRRPAGSLPIRTKGASVAMTVNW